MTARRVPARKPAAPRRKSSRVKPDKVVDTLNTPFGPVRSIEIDMAKISAATHALAKRLNQEPRYAGDFPHLAALLLVGFAMSFASGMTMVSLIDVMMTLLHDAHSKRLQYLEEMRQGDEKLPGLEQEFEARKAEHGAFHASEFMSQILGRQRERPSKSKATVH